MNTPKLPPLPKPDTHCFDDDTGKDVWSHSPAQMQAYAIAAIQAQDNSNGVVVSQCVPDGYAQALQTIADWNAHSLELAVEQGSNGVRDFYRQIAIAALAAAPPAPQVVPRKIPIPPAQAEMMDVVYAEGWNQCCDTFFGGLPPQEPVVITITERDEAPAPQVEDDSAASVNDTNAALAGRYFELLKVVEQYEKSGVTCQTFRHFISEPCAECNSPGICGKQAGVAQPELLGFISPKQVERIVDPDGEFGAYIPMRKTPAGNFTLAVYTHHAQQVKQPPLGDEQIESLCPKFEDPRRREMWIIGYKAAHGIKE